MAPAGALTSAPTATILPSRKQNRGAPQLRSGGGEDGGVPDQDRWAGAAGVGGGVLRPQRAGRIRRRVSDGGRRASGEWREGQRECCWSKRVGHEGWAIVRDEWRVGKLAHVAESPQLIHDPLNGCVRGFRME